MSALMTLEQRTFNRHIDILRNISSLKARLGYKKPLFKNTTDSYIEEAKSDYIKLFDFTEKH